MTPLGIRFVTTMTQKDHLIRYLENHKLARAAELRTEGIPASVVSRAVKSGDVLRVGRGLYQLLDADVDSFITLAEVFT